MTTRKHRSEITRHWPKVGHVNLSRSRHRTGRALVSVESFTTYTLYLSLRTAISPVTVHCIKQLGLSQRRWRNLRHPPTTSHVTLSITWSLDSPYACNAISYWWPVHWNRASISNRFRDIWPQNMLTNTWTHRRTNERTNTTDRNTSWRGGNDAAPEWSRSATQQSSPAIRIAAQSTLAAKHFCPKINAWKIYKMPEFYTTT